MLINEHININELSQFFYDNITFEMFFEFCAIYFFIIWVSLVIWVIKDISNRTNNIFMHIFSIFLIVAFTPIFGFFLYLIIRPSHTLFEQHYEVIENNFDILADILADHQYKTSAHKTPIHFMPIESSQGEATVGTAKKIKKIQKIE